jgi:integrase
MSLRRIGLSVPLNEMMLLYSAYKGWRRLSPQAKKKKAVLSHATLLKILAQPHPKPYKMLLKVAFFNLLRMGEVTGHKAPRGNDFQRRSRALNIPASKTDTFSDGREVVLDEALSMELARFIENEGISGSDYIFRSKTGSPISRKDFCTWLETAAKSVGAPSVKGGHSVRRGGTQHLVDIGTPQDVIKRKGRWSSQCWRLYANTLHKDQEFISGLMQSK